VLATKDSRELAARQWPSGSVGAARRLAFVGLAGQDRLAVGPASADPPPSLIAHVAYPLATAAAPFLPLR
jgi:hypothetical protein